MATLLPSPAQGRDAKPLRIAIIGAGRLGSALRHSLRHHHLSVLHRDDIDLRSRRSVQRALDRVRCDRAILTAAMTDVDACETQPRLTYRVNAEAAGWIAQACARNDAHLTFISSNFVFPGHTHHPLNECDSTGPVNAYGQAKLAAEQLVLAASPRHLITRVSWLFGSAKPSFPEWIIQQAAARHTVPLPCDQSACPTFVPDLADWISLLTSSLSPPGGLLHLANAGCCSRAEWGTACLNHAVSAGFLHPSCRVIPLPSHQCQAAAARRPLHTPFNTTRFQSLTQVKPRHWKSALCDFFRQFPFARLRG